MNADIQHPIFELASQLWTLAAWRPFPVKDCAQHRSPEFFASSANATPGPRRWRFGCLQGESINLRFTNPPPSETQSRLHLRHGEELRGTVQAKAACTGNRQLLTGSESRGPVHLKGNTMIAMNYRKYPEALALQMPLQFGRLLVWATSRPTTRVLRAIRAARSAAFKAAGRVAYPVKRSTPAWAKEAAQKARALGRLVKTACRSLC